MTGGVLAQLAALKGATAPVLKARWRELFDAELNPVFADPENGGLPAKSV